MPLGPKEKLTGLNLGFLETLKTIETFLPAGFTYTITSAYRDPAKNKDVGGVRDSSHESGLAVDVSHGRDIIKAMRIAYALGRAHVIRVGFYDGHVHFDIDPSKPQTQWEGTSK